ncbi:hypothetical protein K488DRAFT_41629, partial [Vararia minispora EC-137]
PASVRSQMSTLKHSIRHQQAQLQHLETSLHFAPRRSVTPVQPSPISPLPSAGRSSPDPNTPSRAKRRSSYEVLQNLAGPDSSLPLPRRDGPMSPPSISEGIPEGIPMDFAEDTTSPTHSRRKSSPTRTLSRIPISAVGNARALAEEVHPPPRYSQALSTPGPLDGSLKPPVSPNTPSSPTPGTKRLSMTPGGTTKVLADLQAGVVNARNALENTKAQLRLSQRSVAQLTRQTEDLKEARERLRLENEGLNAVVARKERLLQEILERARKAESEATALKQQLKLETTTSKKSIKEMESALAASTALSSKAEREYITLRESVKTMKEAWRVDVDSLREDMKKREDRWRKEAEDTTRKHRSVLEQIRAGRNDLPNVEKLRKEKDKANQDVEQSFRSEIDELRQIIERGAEENEKASQTAERLSEELARLRRLMQLARRGREPSPSEFEVEATL